MRVCVVIWKVCTTFCDDVLSMSVYVGVFVRFVIVRPRNIGDSDF